MEAARFLGFRGAVRHGLSLRPRRRRLRGRSVERRRLDPCPGPTCSHSGRRLDRVRPDEPDRRRPEPPARGGDAHANAGRFPSAASSAATERFAACRSRSACGGRIEADRRRQGRQMDGAAAASKRQTATSPPGPASPSDHSTISPSTRAMAARAAACGVGLGRRQPRREPALWRPFRIAAPVFAVRRRAARGGCDDFQSIGGHSRRPSGRICTATIRATASILQRQTRAPAGGAVRSRSKSPARCTRRSAIKPVLAAEMVDQHPVAGCPRRGPAGAGWHHSGRGAGHARPPHGGGRADARGSDAPHACPLVATATRERNVATATGSGRAPHDPRPPPPMAAQPPRWCSARSVQSASSERWNPRSSPRGGSLDLLSWPPDGATTWEHPDTRLLSALAGGFRVGLGSPGPGPSPPWSATRRPRPCARCVLSGGSGSGSFCQARAPSRRAIRPTRSSTSLVLLIAVGPLLAARARGQVGKGGHDDPFPPFFSMRFSAPYWPIPLVTGGPARAEPAAGLLRRDNGVQLAGPVQSLDFLTLLLALGPVDGLAQRVQRPGATRSASSPWSAAWSSSPGTCLILDRKHDGDIRRILLGVR